MVIQKLDKTNKIATIEVTSKELQEISKALNFMVNKTEFADTFIDAYNKICTAENLLKYDYKISLNNKGDALLRLTYDQ